MTATKPRRQRRPTQTEMRRDLSAFLADVMTGRTNPTEIQWEAAEVLMRLLDLPEED